MKHPCVFNWTLGKSHGSAWTLFHLLNWKMRDRRVLVVLLIKILSFVQNTHANEVLGCGGFVKSHAEIDFSKVEIKLLTKQGALKDKTDCSPSNGYYFLPIYDKGEYLLRIAPPPGWSFEPEQVDFNFDGATDICSLGDVNFAFKGFGITGKVKFAGQGGSGARGVKVALKSVEGSDVRETLTDINGIFSFTPIIPAEYIVGASHPRWHLATSEHRVKVTSGNTVLSDDALVVSGFDVHGRFEIGGQMSAGIGVALYRRKGEALPLRCTRGTPRSLATDNPQYESSAACYALVDKSGGYVFLGVAPGSYLVHPVIENPNLKLHINPSMMEFEVLRDAVELRKSFQITGFSVSGRVRSAAGGAPVSGAVVKLNGQHFTETDGDGSYTLDNLKSGAYSLQVEAPQLQFSAQQLNLDLSTASVPDVVPTAYEVCGLVVSQKSHVVGVTRHGSTFHTTVSSKSGTGEWCTYLPSGKYTVEVVTTEADKKAGIKFYPVQQSVSVQSQPLGGITFSQLRAVLRGEVKCLPDAPTSCGGAKVTLHALDATGQPTGQKEVTNVINGKYSFKDILPGPYEVTIPQSRLCFDSTRVLIHVDKAAEMAPPFVQRGYEVSIISTHRAILKYHLGASSGTGATPAPDTSKLLAGVNTFCVPHSGIYHIKVESCHGYDESLPRTFDTADPTPVRINALSHKVGVRVLTTEPQAANLIRLGVESASLAGQLVAPTLEGNKVEGKFAYRYETHLRPEEVLSVTPESEILLFTPQRHEIMGGQDCVDVAFTFVATRGLILRGKVVPPIKDVHVSLAFPSSPQLAVLSTQTDKAGQFKFPPIDAQLKYELFAKKESYVFSPFDPQSGSFSALKLCEIVVRVRDETTNRALGGVLLSLSGGESYRKNLVTGDNGAINFHSLSPSQYFLRPMMKEYKFEPISKMIELRDGETVEVELLGKRVAYSVFGVVTSLNGEPFGQVNVEAVADERCQHHQEEATSENSGQYRIRGLQPGCVYTVRPKDIGAAGTNIERSIPSSLTVKVGKEDERAMNLIAISPVRSVDVTARVTAPLNEQYKTLRVVLYRRGAADSPVYSQRVESPLNLKSRYNPGIMVFIPRIPLDGKSYVVELQSTLSDKTYTYTLPSSSFVADTSSVFVELDFRPEVRVAESDLNQNSISALLLVALVAIAFFKQDLAMDFLNFVWTKANGLAQDLAQKQRGSNKKDSRKTEPINQREIEQMAEQINAIKKKKTKKI